MPQLDFTHIVNEAKKLEKQLTELMSEFIAIPGHSGDEEPIIKRIEKEMHSIGFDEVKIDKMGNIIGRIGNGKTTILMDAHVDTVGPGSLNEWKTNPYEAQVKDGIIYGRGASDQRGGMVSMLFAARLIKEFDLLDDYTLFITGTCLEEPCEGLCLFHIITEEKLIQPDYVVITEPTNLRICRGQPGRIEMKLTTKGRSCHSSAPQQGINAIYRMQPIIEGIETLNRYLLVDNFLGKGTISVTGIESKSPSKAAVPNECTIYIDRRLTAGETKELALKQIQDIIDFSSPSIDADLEVIQYSQNSWTGMKVGMEKYFPGWVMPEDHIITRSAVKTAEAILDQPVPVSKWAFSTNGIATLGTLGIPTIGFGPGNDMYAHTINDQVPIQHLALAAAFYATFPQVLLYQSTKENDT